VKSFIWFCLGVLTQRGMPWLMHTTYVIAIALLVWMHWPLVIVLK